MLDISIFQVYLDKKDTCVTNRNKPWIDIFLAIHGNDFICKLLDFGEVFIINTLKQEKKKHFGKMFLSYGYALLKLETVLMS